MGRKLGLDLEGNPELAESPEVSVLTALEYWKSRGLNTFADSDDVTMITRKINGGLNGFADRKTYLAKAKTVIPKSILLADTVTPTTPPKVDLAAPATPSMPSTPPVIIVAQRGNKSPYVGDIQNLLIRKGATITSDGDFGPKTEQAVKDFQAKNGLEITGSIDTNTLNKLMAI
jgi:putative chitinase